MNPARSFPIDQSYINLVIVNTKDQLEKEKQMDKIQHGDAIMGTYEDIYGVKRTIDVKDILKSCENEKKQVLVFGRAGIGKSTFCRYIVYQWARGSFLSEYELVVLIPLRRLTTNRYPPNKEHTLVDLVIKEVFSFELSNKEEQIFKEQFDAKKILWILDGYDEIIGNIPTHLECLFGKLLNTPHHILTSRPYLNTLSYAVQMEITGFTDKNITEYIHQFFELIEEKSENDIIKKNTLLKFLKSKQSIWGIAHIPVNLELICSVWSNQDLSEIRHLTITTLYTAMTEWLCRRYLMLQSSKIQILSKKKLYENCHKEITFLETLAFHAMKNNTIIIQPRLLNKIIEETQIDSEEDYPKILKIGLLKSFDKGSTGNQLELEKDHYFIHLSFQEYFAARYLIHALNDSKSEEAKVFINHQKYNQRYALVFQFISGLISETHSQPKVEMFWNIILRDPLDMVGIRHMQLVISCLDAASDITTIPNCSELLERIANYIKHCILQPATINSNEIIQYLKTAESVVNHEIILQMLISLLEHSDTHINQQTLILLGDLNVLNQLDKISSLIVNFLSHQNDLVRWRVCEALGKMGEKAATNEVIEKLVSALGDNDLNVRRSAHRALGNMGEKVATNEVIEKLVSLLEDEHYSVRMSVCEALGNMGEKAATNEVIEKLVSALGDDESTVRRSACEALGKMGEKAATNEVIEKLVSALGDQDGWVSESACKALAYMGEKAATNEVIDKLVSLLGDQNASVRWNACKALAYMGEKAATNEVIDKLVSLLGDQDDSVRESACEALGKMGEEAATNEVIEMLVSLLGDNDYNVRYSARDTLDNMGEEAATNEVIEMLVSLLGDQDDSVRESACEALGDMGEKAATNEVIEMLVSALEDEHYSVRESACKALGDMGEKAATNEVIEMLVSALEDEHYSVRESACKALAYMGEKAATNEVIEMLVSALEDEHYSVRKSACAALGLGYMGEKVATNEMIEKFVSLLGDQNASVRGNAYRALGYIGEKAARNEVIEKLLSALEDENGYVRYSACEALGKMGEKVPTNYVIETLLKMMKNGKQVDDLQRLVVYLLKVTSVLERLDSRLILDCYELETSFDILEGISLEKLMKGVLFNSDRNWILILSRCAVLCGAALIECEDVYWLYDEKEPISLVNIDSKTREDLKEIFKIQRERLHLLF